MTAPTIVFFGYDLVPKTTPKIFLRTLLYSTAAQGQVVEGMYAVLRREGAERAFSFWGYGESEKLSPGSGLHVSRCGLAANHHFVMSVHDADYLFEPGCYTIVVYARVVGRRKPIKLSELEIGVSAEQSRAMKCGNGMLFERRLEGGYEGHARER